MLRITKTTQFETWYNRIFLYLSIGLAFVGIIVSYSFYYADDVFIDTLSLIGSYRQEQFLIWSLIVALAFVTNLKAISIKLELSFKKSLPLDILIILNLPLTIAQAITLESGVNNIHFPLAIVYTTHSLLTIILFLALITIKKFRTHKSFFMGGFFLFWLLAVAGFLNIIAVSYSDALIAFYQLLLVIISIIVICVMHLLVKESANIEFNRLCLISY
ncbi:MAG: hypothetical protein FWE13_03955 [Firmicutes bacterium]|nr:hypothetical protein [Bacillota bacterium]